jgi:hypothetical protein
LPGVRDRNLRSGDLHEELGIFLLKAVALVAPVPRQEDVGNDAFATLIWPEGGRRLIPDVSFLVQLKSASITSVSYTTPEAMAWIRTLDTPLFIGRVDLKQAKIELFTTLRLHQILLEHDYSGIELLLDPAGETSTITNVRRARCRRPTPAEAHRAQEVEYRRDTDHGRWVGRFGWLAESRMGLRQPHSSDGHRRRPAQSNSARCGSDKRGRAVISSRSSPRVGPPRRTCCARCTPSNVKLSACCAVPAPRALQETPLGATDKEHRACWQAF